MRLVFIGPPGVGKGTQSDHLVEHLKIVHLSTGDMLRQAKQEHTELGIEADRFMSVGQLVPDDLMLELVSRRLEAPDCRAGFLLDGFPRTLWQAQALDLLLKKRGTPLNLALALTADDDELIKRLLARGREDDQLDVVRRRLVEYDRQTAPLLDYYRQQGLLYAVDGEGPPEEVFERIKDLVDKLADK